MVGSRNNSDVDDCVDHDGGAARVGAGAMRCVRTSGRPANATAIGVKRCTMAAEAFRVEAQLRQQPDVDVEQTCRRPHTPQLH